MILFVKVPEMGDVLFGHIDPKLFFE